VFVSTLAPERTGSAINTFLIGGAIFVIGVIPVYTIKNRFFYRRLEFDREKLGDKQVE